MNIYGNIHLNYEGEGGVSLCDRCSCIHALRLDEEGTTEPGANSTV